MICSLYRLCSFSRYIAASKNGERLPSMCVCVLMCARWALEPNNCDAATYRHDYLLVSPLPHYSVIPIYITTVARAEAAHEKCMNTHTHKDSAWGVRKRWWWGAASVTRPGNCSVWCATRCSWCPCVYTYTHIHTGMHTHACQPGAWCVCGCVAPILGDRPIWHFTGSTHVIMQCTQLIAFVWNKRQQQTSRNRSFF